jgi:hypothetical protein
MNKEGDIMTAQMHEKLILEGEATTMAFCPPIPFDNPRIVLNEQQRIMSTGCWRGYIGTWELEEGRLYLVDITGLFQLVGDDPLPADWVTGVLRIPHGDLLQYIHMGFGSIYEFETHLKIENGVVVDERRIANRDKDNDPNDLRWNNLPGNENNFDGDDL